MASEAYAPRRGRADELLDETAATLPLGDHPQRRYGAREQTAPQLPQMGTRLDVDERWPGPGVAQPVTFSDASLRNFYERWLELMRE